MAPPEDVDTITRIIACGVFKTALGNLHLEERCPDLRITYLESKLHLRPLELKKRLSDEITAAQERSERVICLYGNCFPEIDELCKQYGAARVTGDYCYQMLLGSERFSRIISETAGTYFVERDLALNFEKYCIEPLELRDEEIRRIYFEHYRKLLYVCQPDDHGLEAMAAEIADFLGLTLDIQEADYTDIEKELIGLIKQQSVADP